MEACLAVHKTYRSGGTKGKTHALSDQVSDGQSDIKQLLTSPTFGSLTPSLKISVVSGCICSKMFILLVHRMHLQDFHLV